MKAFSFFLVCMALLSPGKIFAQKKNSSFKITMNKATDQIKVDGVMNENSWLKASVASNFFMVLPTDTSKASV